MPIQSSIHSIDMCLLPAMLQTPFQAENKRDKRSCPCVMVWGLLRKCPEAVDLVHNGSCFIPVTYQGLEK